MTTFRKEETVPEKDGVSLLELVGAGAVLLVIACLFIL